MARRIELYFDFTCPYAYLASTCIEDIAAAGGAHLCWRPMLLGGVFRAIGDGSSPMERMVAAKARHNALDMQRWADRMGVPLVMPAGHPMRSVRALRTLLSLPETDWPAVIHEMYRAYWQRAEDIAAAPVIARVLERAGVDPARIEPALAADQDPAIKDQLRQRTDEAVARGVFGVPAMFVHVDDQPEPYFFWGQDRLYMVQAVLAGWRPGQAGPTPADDTADEPPPEPEPASVSPDAGRARVHFFYDFSSPFAYLGATQIERVVADTGATLCWRPMLLGALFRDVGTPNVPLLAMSESKRRYIARDLEHWASYFHVPFRFASHFPQRTVTALRLALLAGDRIAELSHALFRVAWVDDGDLDDILTLARVLEAQGFPAEDMLARTRAPEVKQMLADNTAEAMARGVFGAPTCVVEQPGERAHEPREWLFWGQDRLSLVRATLRGWRPDAKTIATPADASTGSGLEPPNRARRRTLQPPC